MLEVAHIRRCNHGYHRTLHLYSDDTRFIQTFVLCKLQNSLPC